MTGLKEIDDQVISSDSVYTAVHCAHTRSFPTIIFSHSNTRKTCGNTRDSRDRQCDAMIRRVHCITTCGAQSIGYARAPSPQDEEQDLSAFIQVVPLCEKKGFRVRTREERSSEGNLLCRERCCT